MKKIFIVILCIFMISGCNDNKEVVSNSSVTDKITYKEITASQAYQMMDDNVFIIDVREEDEYNSGHIENAINISVNTIVSEISNTVDSFDSVILLYCKSGSRALTAARKLVSKGYKNVYTFGGINNWPYELVY